MFKHLPTSPDDVVRTARFAPVITHQDSSKRIYLNGYTTLNVTVSGTAPFSYHWYKNGKLIPTKAHGTLTFYRTSHDDEGIYKCEITNVVGKTISNDISVLISDPPSFKWKIQPTSITKDLEEYTYFKAVAGGNEFGDVTYEWKKYNYAQISNPNEQPITIPDSNSFIYEIDSLSPEEIGDYVCVATSTVFGPITSNRVSFKTTNYVLSEVFNEFVDGENLDGRHYYVKYNEEPPATTI